MGGDDGGGTVTDCHWYDYSCVEYFSCDFDGEMTRVVQCLCCEKIPRGAGTGVDVIFCGLTDGCVLGMIRRERGEKVEEVPAKCLSPFGIKETCLSCLVESMDVVWIRSGEGEGEGEEKVEFLCLAVGCSDGKIWIYVGETSCFGEDEEEKDENVEGFRFRLVCKLTGHEDWIRAVAFCQMQDRGSVFLASGGQDQRVRVWRMTQVSEQTDSSRSLLAASWSFQVGSGEVWEIELETVFLAHNEWVMSVSWGFPKNRMSVEKYSDLRLVTCSTDRLVKVWGPKPSLEDLWIADAQMGHFGGLTGMFSRMGFYGVYANYSFDDDDHGDQLLVAHAYNGALHCWTRENEEMGEIEEDEGNSEHWVPRATSGGHHAPVKDLDVCDSYILSSGVDQTTRLFASPITQRGSMFEISRPMIHGHDIHCVGLLSSQVPRHCFVCCSAEKNVRVYVAPKVVLQTLRGLCGVNLLPNDPDGEAAFLDSRPLGAMLPTLSLSNKAMRAVPDDVDESQHRVQRGQDGEMQFRARVFLDAPPLELNLLQDTLWPEHQKLFGHINPVVALAIARDVALMATSADSKKRPETGIRVWTWEPRARDSDDIEWRETQVLKTGTLTVTSMSFSEDDRFLLSVTRDRCIQVFERQDDLSLALTASQGGRSRVHKKAIWGCSWSRARTAVFATGSRDKTLKFWRVLSGHAPSESLQLLESVAFSSAVTSVEFAPSLWRAVDLLAVGLENGNIHLLWLDRSVDSDRVRVLTDSVVSQKFSHDAAVTRCRWRFVVGQEDHLELVTCGDDWAVRVFRVS